MATIFPPQSGNIGSAQAVQWLTGEYVPAGSTKASIHGSRNAIFGSGGAGSETIDIGVGAGAPVTVTSAGTEASPSNWVSTINGTGGLAGVAALDVLGGIRIGDAARVRVTGYGGSGGADAAFAVIGLPIMDRDTAAPVTSLQVGPSENIQQVSTAIAVPPTANRCGIVLKGSGTGTLSTETGVMLAWSDGTIGEPSLQADAVTSLYDLLADAFLNAPILPPGAYDDRPMLIDTYVIQRLMAGATDTRKLLSFEIPSGMTQLRVAALTARLDNNGGLAEKESPTVEATVYFSKR